MSDTSIIAIVVFVALVAHVWIFMWVKFKMDESAIINLLKKHAGNHVCSTDEIATSTDLKTARVAKICTSSKAIVTHHQSNNQWCLSK